MPTEYDANILQVYADDLYIQARFIVFTTALRYGLMTLFFLGLISGVAIEIFVLSMPPRYPSSALQIQAVWAIAVTTLIATAVGIGEGRRKAFRLKLEAQQLLCQRQVELNTRAAIKTPTN